MEQDTDTIRPQIANNIDKTFNNDWGKAQRHLIKCQEAWS